MTDQRRIEVCEPITAAPARALAGLLGAEEPGEGDALEPLWHWVYLLDRPRQVDLGPDGHPIVGGVPSPPAPGRRRMFAGGRVRAHCGLVIGRPATRTSYVRASTEKSGRTGQLTFVTVAHEIRQGGRLVVDEEQDIVYREARSPTPSSGDRSSVPAPSTTLAPAPLAVGEFRFTVDPVVLFRFSALTYNGHRIHYDRDYARNVEGYPGLVVHGPLQAVLMAGAGRRRRTDDGSRFAFEYRLIAPLCDTDGLVVAATASDGSAVETAVRDKRGRRTAVGRYDVA